MKRSITLLIIFFTNAVHAQNANFVWAKSYGGTDQDIGRKIIRNDCGDIYTVGFFSETTDMDPGTGITNVTSNGGKDIYINKFDGLGNFIWTKNIGGSMDDEVGTIVTDALGDIYVTGTFHGMVDFDPGTGTSFLNSAADAGGFLLKIDTAGNFLWVKQLVDKGSVYGHTIKMAASGNIYVTGIFHGTVDLDPGPAVFNLTSAVANWDDIFISKFNSNGDFIWAKQFTGSFIKGSIGIEVDNQENVFICGNFVGTVDFDPGPAIYNLSTSIPATKLFLTKLNIDGNFIWAKEIGGNNSVIPRGVVMDSNFNVYVTGDFYGHIDFDPGTASYFLDAYGGYPACFVVKLTMDGNLVWARRFGGQSPLNSSATGIDITLDATKNIYVSGTFSGTVDFGDFVTLVSIGADLFVLKLANNGDFSFVKQMGGVGAQSPGISICVDKANNIYVTGTLYGPGVDYDPGPGTYSLASNGITDAFMLKLSQCDQPTSATIKKTICADTSDNYVLGCYTYRTTGIYSQVLINAAGCDSIVTLDLRFGENPVPELGPDKEQCIDSTKNFILQTQNNYAGYEWSTGLTTPILSVQNLGEYWVKVKDAVGCEGSDTIKVVPKQCVIDLFMPSAFSPNGDQLNDVLKPGVYGALASFKMEVYNRYGQLIFKTSDAAKGWDGKFKGTPVPTGVFVWQCSYQFQGKAIEYQKGTVTLFR